MKIDEWLEASTKRLDQAGISTARLDCLVLLEDATGKDRSWLLAHPGYGVKGSSFHTLQKQVEQRAQHVPLAYIRGKTEFYGREFLINADVLEPRPESETMIDLLKNLKLPARQIIADVGTGSGALAITAKIELPKAEVTATDIDPKCLNVAQKSAQKHGVKVEFLQGDLLEPLQTSGFRTQDCIILANLPYVPDSHTVNDAAQQEPKIAIFGGPDGLDLYRKLFQQINTKPNRPKYVLTESLPFQHKELTKIAADSRYRLAQTDDFIQVFEAIPEVKLQA